MHVNGNFNLAEQNFNLDFTKFQSGRNKILIWMKNFNLDEKIFNLDEKKFNLAKNYCTALCSRTPSMCTRIRARARRGRQGSLKSPRGASTPTTRSRAAYPRSLTVSSTPGKSRRCVAGLIFLLEKKRLNKFNKKVGNFWGVQDNKAASCDYNLKEPIYLTFVFLIAFFCFLFIFLLCFFYFVLYMALVF